MTKAALEDFYFSLRSMQSLQADLEKVLIESRESLSPSVVDQELSDLFVSTGARLEERRTQIERLLQLRGFAEELAPFQIAPDQ